MIIDTEEISQEEYRVQEEVKLRGAMMKLLSSFEKKIFSESESNKDVAKLIADNNKIMGSLLYKISELRPDNTSIVSEFNDLTKKIESVISNQEKAISLLSTKPDKMKVVRDINGFIDYVQITYK